MDGFGKCYGRGGLGKCRPVYMYSLGIFCVPKSSAHENTKINTIINISNMVFHWFSTAEYALSSWFLVHVCNCKSHDLSLP